MTRLFLLRHGQTDWNREKRYQGQLDETALNATGLAQVLVMAQSLQDEHFAALFTSPLWRARQTAQVLSTALQIPVQVDARLTEISHGDWEGRLLEEVRREIAQTEGDPRLLDPQNGRPPGGESLYEVYLRMAAAADAYTASYPYSAVLIVSHGIAIAALICKASGIPLDQVYHLIPDNSDIVSLDWPSGPPLHLATEDEPRPGEDTQ
jgi:broad specificity phosphatase PhoE